MGWMGSQKNTPTAEGSYTLIDVNCLLAMALISSSSTEGKMTYFCAFSVPWVINVLTLKGFQGTQKEEDRHQAKIEMPGFYLAIWWTWMRNRFKKKHNYFLSACYNRTQISNRLINWDLLVREENVSKTFNLFYPCLRYSFLHFTEV